MASEILNFLFGVLSGAAIVIIADYLGRRIKAERYIRMAENAKNLEFELEVQKLFQEERAREKFYKAGVRNDVNRIDLDVMAAASRKKLRKNKKKDFYQARPNNSASWGSD